MEIQAVVPLSKRTSSRSLLLPERELARRTSNSTTKHDQAMNVYEVNADIISHSSPVPP